MRLLHICLVFMLLMISANSLAAGDENLVAEGIANNPEITMAQARWDMLREKVKQAGTLADPMLMLGVKNMVVRYPLAFDKDPTTAKIIGLSQMIPTWGKRELQRVAAEQEAKMTGFDYDERRLELARMIKETRARLIYTDQALRLLERSIGTLDGLIRFSETMYSVGEGRQQDVLRAQVELSRMRDMQLGLRQNRRSLEATMNALLARPALTPFPVETQTELVPVRADAATLSTLADQRRPLLRKLETQREKGRTGQALARKEYFPDFTVSAEYMQIEPVQTGGGMGGGETTSGDDMYSLTVSFNLPFQQEKRDAMLREAKAETRMAEQELQVARNSIDRDLADGLARLDRTREMAELYRTTIIPQSVSALEAAVSAYQAGTSDFMAALDAQMRLIETERQYFEAVAEHRMQVALLENLTGGPLDATPHPDDKEIVP